MNIKKNTPGIIVLLVLITIFSCQRQMDTIPDAEPAGISKIIMPKSPGPIKFIINTLNPSNPDTIKFEYDSKGVLKAIGAEQLFYNHGRLSKSRINGLKQYSYVWEGQQLKQVVLDSSAMIPGSVGKMMMLNRPLATFSYNSKGQINTTLLAYTEYPWEQQDKGCIVKRTFYYNDENNVDSSVLWSIGAKTIMSVFYEHTYTNYPNPFYTIYKQFGVMPYTLRTLWEDYDYVFAGYFTTSPNAPSKIYYDALYLNIYDVKFFEYEYDIDLDAITTIIIKDRFGTIVKSFDIVYDTYTKYF